MSAIAISNNDMVYLHWHFSGKIAGCLGFSIIRHEPGKNSGVPLPAMVGFAAAKPAGNKFKDTDTWPVQLRAGTLVIVGKEAIHDSPPPRETHSF